MGVLLRTAGVEQSQVPAAKRAVAVLTDNSVVTATWDNNQTGVPAGGGDATGVPKLFIIHSTDRINHTLKNTVTLNSLSGQGILSMCSDSGNNLHVVYRTNTGSLSYTKGTWAAGPVWTFSGGVQVAPFPDSVSAGINIQYTRVDIDVVGTGDTPVVAASLTNYIAGQKKVELRCFVKNTAAAWTAQTVQNLVPGDTALSWSEDVSVSANQTAIAADNMGYFAVSAQRISSTGKDYGGVVYIFKTLMTTGVTQRVDTLASGFGAGYGDKLRKFWLFNMSNNRWLLTGQVSLETNWQAMSWVFDWNTTTNVATTVVPMTTSSGKGGGVKYSRHAWCTVSYSRGTETISYFGFAAGYIYNFAAYLDLVNGKINYQPSYQKYHDIYRPSGIPPSAMWGGAHPRSTVAGQFADIVVYWWKSGTTNVYRFEYVRKNQPSAPTGIKPATGSIVNTDRPLLYAAPVYTVDYSPFRSKQQWQIASDSGFTTNLRVITESDSSYRSTEKNMPLPIGRTTVDAVGELTQAVWYIRSRTIDEYGWIGPYSSGQSFTVSHVPSATNMSPKDNNILIYGSLGQANFSWQFTDPSPYDYQTAYRVLVERDDNGSVVVDTGKTLATVNTRPPIIGSAVVTIPASFKDVLLRWSLFVWDTDDVMSVQSSYRNFLITDAPAPTITAPTANQVLSTATPTVIWTPGVGAGKAQTDFRVLITSGDAQVFDSTWTSGTATSLPIPVGYLKNGFSYTVSVFIRDNLNLDGFTSQQFSTSWAVPASPTGLLVDVSQLDSRGFVYISQNPAGYDVDFIAYNLYKRALGATDWTLVTAWTSPAASFLAYRDFLVGANQTYQYCATQVVERFGDISESPIDTGYIVTAKTVSSTYWLIHPDNASGKSMPIYQVNTEDPVEEYEEETYNVLNRGRHTDYGDRLGYTGTLSSQLRDRLLYGKERTNFVLNPTITKRSADTSLPSRFVTYTAGVVTSILTAIEAPVNPPITGKPEICRLDVTAIGPLTSAQGGIQTLVSVRDIRVESTWDTFAYVSFWTRELILDASHAVRMRLRTMNGGTQVVDSGYVAPTLLDSNGYSWKRYGSSIAVAANVTDIEISVGIGGTGGSTTVDQTILLTGLQLETGGHSAYHDGNQYGSDWIGVPDDSVSITKGFYTARQQKQDLTNLKAQLTYLYLRNPFGDVWKVSTGNIGFTRVAGVGTSEFTDATIPYREVGF